MRKRITLPVDRLVAKQNKPIKQPPEKSSHSKPLTFDQLYQMARKQSLSMHPHPYMPYYSANVSQQFTQSLKSSISTPQNSTRNCHKPRNVSDKLNRSLQAKSESLEKINRPIRSFSNQKRLLVEQWKNEKNNREGRELRRGKENKKSNSQKSQVENFQSEYSALISQLDHNSHAHLRQTECFLSIEQTFKMMKQLHYLRKIEDEKYLVKIWQQLEGQTYGGIPSQNLYQFFTYINHYNPKNFYPKHKASEAEPQKKIIINSNLKIVASEQKKLQIYQEYLALRVNRILYGNGESDNGAHDQKLQKTSNIKIVDDDLEQTEAKTKPSQARSLFAKKPSSQNEVVVSAPKRSVKLRSVTLKTKKQEQTCEKQASEETVCYSDVSESKQSGQNLTSSESESSIHASEPNEEVPEKKPILSIDVNLGEGVSEKLLVYEGQTAVDVSRRLVQKYNIDEQLRMKFQTMLHGHIRNLLWRIEQVSEEMFSDRQE